MKANGADNWLMPQLWPIFEKSYANAVAAFSQILRTDVTHSTYFTGLHALPAAGLAPFLPVPEASCDYVVSTELLGELNGMSYLILSQADVENLSKMAELRDDTLRDEFLKELDNILSAAVITVLSNELKTTSYGDVPFLFRDLHQAVNLHQAVKEDLPGHSGLFFISAAVFEARTPALLRATFLWVVDVKSLKTAIASRSAIRVSR